MNHLARGSKRRGKGAGRGRKANRDGCIVKAFNIVGPRPRPSLVSSLAQINVTMESTGTLFTTSTTVPVFSGSSFTVGSFDSSAEYLGLFDQYRIDRLELTITPMIASTAVFADIAYAIDYDDANTPTAFAAVAAKMKSYVGLGGVGVMLSFVPHVALGAYSGTFTGFSNEEAMWIDSGSPSVQHYALKTAAMPTPVAIPYIINLRALVSFRCPAI